jgi:exonuclease SbcC
MIITGVSATDILKYQGLELRDLPERGIIGITGANESGKSSIGETVCFALFGRTFSLATEEITKIIRWGQPRCSVSVDFVVDAGAVYQIARFLDRDGNHGVRLGRVETPDDPIARGDEAVGDALYELIGYDYEEFIESFYLAQREITTPHPHSHAIKSMAGLNALEFVASEFEEDIEEDIAAIATAEQETTDIEQQLQDLGIQPQLLGELESRRDRLEAQDAACTSSAEALERASAAYEDSVPQMRTARSRRAWGGTLAVLFLLVALAAGGAWGTLTQMPGSDIAGQLNALLQRVPQWTPDMLRWIPFVAGGFGLLFLIAWVRAARAGSRIRELGKTADALAEQLVAVPDTVAAARAALTENALTSMLEAPQAGEGESANDETASEDESAPRLVDNDEAALADRVREFEVSAESARASVGDVVSRIHGVASEVQHALEDLRAAIVREQSRRDKAKGLNKILEGCRDKTTGLRRRVQLRELANDLIFGASRQISHRFNRDLRESVGQTLPLFTENRYEYLQIDDELNVRVFSTEKRDFMDLEEISSGTQRQIMLAVRLCLSQELVNRAVKGRQFVFLDEPFAFFDQERTRNAMTALPQLSEQLGQVWIIGQEFPPDIVLDRHIRCERGALSVSSP